MLGGEDDDLGAARQRPGQEVERVGRVAGEDDLVALTGADEAGDLVARGLVVVARHLAGPPLAAVDARVGLRRLVDGRPDAGQSRGGGAVVEVRVLDERAVAGRDLGRRDDGRHGDRR